MKTKTVKVIADQHIHTGRTYPKGAIIKDMPVASADWLIGLKKVEEAAVPANAEVTK